MIRVVGEKLYQYQKGRKVQLIPQKGVDIKKVTFQKGGNVYDGVVEADKTALIPDVLLISAGVLTVQYEGVNDSGYRRKEKNNIEIHRAERPADYVKPDVSEQIPTGGGSTGGSGLGGGIAIINLTDGFGLMEEKYTCDKTGAEIVELFNNGVLPVLVYGWEIFHLAIINGDNSVVFESRAYQFTISEDGNEITTLEF